MELDEVNVLVKKCVVLGLIDQTYLIENLYRKGDLQQGAYVLDSLREGLKELSDDL
ncbi:hypothetical protein ACD661_15335 [Legionella lytica]|uniref:Uncharacterized protein n=1 Tax=Legionella lytica TaxID=96232 RepID=A0ABW8DB41_9GAMM